MNEQFTLGGKLTMYLLEILFLPWHLLIFVAGVSAWLHDKGNELILESYKKNS